MQWKLRPEARPGIEHRLTTLFTARVRGRALLHIKCDKEWSANQRLRGASRLFCHCFDCFPSLCRGLLASCCWRKGQRCTECSPAILGRG